MKEWLSFTERLHFVEIAGRMFAVMAYSNGDAWRQVNEAQWHERWTGHWERMLEKSMSDYVEWTVRVMAP